MYQQERIQDALYGRVIKEILIDAEKQEYLSFITDNGPINFATYGDCCSETWIADIMNPENILGQVVTNVLILDVEDKEDGRSRQEVDSFYGLQLNSVKGSCQIIYRNSSNGYYGGDIEMIENLPSECVMRSVTQDYSA